MRFSLYYINKRTRSITNAHATYNFINEEYDHLLISYTSDHGAVVHHHDYMGWSKQYVDYHTEVVSPSFL